MPGEARRFSIVAHLAKDDEVKKNGPPATGSRSSTRKAPTHLLQPVLLKSAGVAETVEEEKTESTENTETTEVTETTETTEESTEKVEETNEETTEVTETTEEKPANTESTEETATTEVSTEKTETAETTKTTEAPTTNDMPDVPEPEVVVVEEGADTNKPPAGNPEDAEEIKPDPAPVTTKGTASPTAAYRHTRRQIKRRFFRSPAPRAATNWWTKKAAL